MTILPLAARLRRETALMALLVLLAVPVAAHADDATKTLMNRMMKGDAAQESAEDSQSRLQMEAIRAIQSRDAGAEAAVDALLAHDRATLDGLDPRNGRSLLIAQKFYELTDRPARQAEIINRRIAIAEAVSGKDSDAVIELRAALAVALAYGGQGRKGLAMLAADRVILTTRHGADSLAMINLLVKTGDSYEAMGKATAAEPYYRQALAALTAHHPGEQALFDQVSFELVQTLNRIGKYADAEPFVRANLVRQEAQWTAAGGSLTAAPTMSNMVESQNLVSFMVLLADNLSGQGKAAEADVFYDRATALAIHVGGADSDKTGYVHNQRAYWYNLTGWFKQAEPYGKLAYEIWTKTRGADNIATAKAGYNYATALLGQGNAAAAIPYYRSALPIQRAGYAGDHPDLAILLTTLSKALTQTPNGGAEALTLAREAAQIVRTRSDARFGGEGAGDEGDPGARALARAVAGDTSQRDPLVMAYGALMQAAWQSAGNGGSGGKLQAEAFAAAQDLEQSAAGQAMAEAAARSLAGDGPLGQLVRRKQDLNATARRLDKELAAALATRDPAQIRIKQSDAVIVAAALAETDAELRRDFPDYAALVSTRALDLGGVQQRLGKDEGLLLVVPSDADVFVFAVSNTGVRWNRMAGGGTRITALVNRLRCRIDEPSCPNEADLDPVAADPKAVLTDIDNYYPRYDRAAAFALYNELIAPVELGLNGAKRVYATISGPLSGLPLATLLTAAPVGAPESGEAADLKASAWLSDRYAFITLPSVSALRAIKAAGKKRDGAQTAFVGYGNPVLQGTPAASRGIAKRGGRRWFRSVDGSDITMADPATLRSLAPLPGTEAELGAMARALDADAGMIHLGNAAREGMFRNDATLGRARVLAIATHGVLPRDISGVNEPGLVFTPPDKADAADDGLLTASEAAQLKLDADWLILSACNTASTDGTPGAESLSSLARAFLYAGAKSMLASHWRVADDVTAALTVETLTIANRHPDLSRAQALQWAIKAIRTGIRADGTAVAGWQPHWTHPAAWGPFTLIANED